MDTDRGCKIRKQNVVFTVSGDYNRVPPISLFDEYGDYRMDFYRMMLLGYIEKTVDMDVLITYLYEHLKKTSLKNEFLKFIELFFDGTFYKSLHKDRKGSSDYRDYFISSRMEFLSKIEERSVEHEIEYIYYGRLKNKYFEGKENVVELVDLMRNFQKTFSNKLETYCVDCRDEDRKKRITNEVMDFINRIFLKYFYVNTRSTYDPFRIDDAEEKREKINPEKSESRMKFRLSTKSLRDIKDNEKMELVSIESAEFTGSISDDISIDDERLATEGKKISRSNDQVIDMVRARYGESIYPRYSMDSYERDICTGVHKGIKLHITDGKFSDGHDKYFEKSIALQREKNLEYYRDNELGFRRAISILTEILRKKLKVEDDDEIIKSNNGHIDISKVWRKKYLDEDYIFKKVIKNGLGSVSVDILMDSSASQIEREEYVSSQAFIISEALCAIGIPTRVMGFCNLFNCMVITRYRDYLDSSSHNKKIFDYKGSGSNRDGLAIKVVADQMEKNEYENKILIVLSDGKPNDKINLGTTGFFDVDGEDYEGELAIMDTASEIFSLKLRNRYVLGVFTGKEEDLESEKKIYGRDFAYIRNMDRFSQIIGFFIDKTLK